MPGHVLKDIPVACSDQPIKAEEGPYHNLSLGVQSKLNKGSIYLSILSK